MRGILGLDAKAFSTSLGCSREAWPDPVTSVPFAALRGFSSAPAAAAFDVGSGALLDLDDVEGRTCCSGRDGSIVEVVGLETCS